MSFLRARPGKQSVINHDDPAADGQRFTLVMGYLSRRQRQALLPATRVVAGQAPVIAEQADIAQHFDCGAQGVCGVDARQRQAAGSRQDSVADRNWTGLARRLFF